MGHADSIYAMAHAITLDATEAVLLVEAVYERAARESMPPGADEKLWLLRLLREERAQPQDDSTEAEAPAQTAGDFRIKLSRRAVQREMPAAFASLTPQARELLMLIHVERHAVEDIAALVELPIDSLEEHLAGAEMSLRASVLSGLAPSERNLLSRAPSDWIRAAINDMVANDLPAMPPTVRTDLGPASETQPEAARNEPPSPRRTSKPGERLRRAATALFIIFLVGLFAYGAARILDQPPETDALVLSVEASSGMDLDIATDDAAEVERYLLDNIGWRLVVPAIEGATLMGAQIREVSEDIRVPALYYDDSRARGPITLVAYTYALLDRSGERLHFEPATLSQIQNQGHYELHDVGRRQLLIWRHRNNIFVAVTRGTAEALQDRIYPSD